MAVQVPKTVAQLIRPDAPASAARTALGLGDVATHAAADFAAAAHTHTTAAITDLGSWAGSTALVTLGTIAAGTWHGSPVAVAYLGSGTPAAGKYLDGAGSWTTLPAGGSGTVTSVALTVPGVLFSVAGSPVTTAGTLAFALLTQAANTVLAGPTAGAAAAPTLRALVAADLGTGTADSAHYLRGDLTWATPAAGLAVGSAVSGGGANRVLYEDASANLAASADLTFPSGVLLTGSTAAATAAVGVESSSGFPGFWLDSRAPDLNGTPGMWWNSTYGRLYVGTGSNSVPWILTAPSGTLIWAQLDAIGLGGGSTVVGSPAAACHAQPRLNTTPALIAQGASTQSANLQEWQDSSATVLSTVSENGYFTTRRNSAPADAELIAGEAAWWFDSTNGAARLVAKGKTANGTVVSGSFNLT